MGGRGLPAGDAGARAAAACGRRGAGAGAAEADGAARACGSGSAASPTRSTRSRSPGWHCGSRTSTGREPGEERYRELKLLVVHRDDLVDERRRAQQRLRWHLHQLDPAFRVPAGALDRTVWLDRVGRWLARRTPEVQVRIARDLVSRCRSLTRAIGELDRELATTERADGAGAARAARLRRPHRREAARPRSDRSNASAPTHNSPATAASHHSKQAQAAHNATDSTAAATANSTAPCTASRSPKHASTRPPATTSNARKPKARATAKRSAASNDNSHAPSSTRSKASPTLT